MGRGIGDIIFGLIFIAGGLSGKLALIGTNSGEALAALGAALCAYGGYKIFKARG